MLAANSSQHFKYPNQRGVGLIEILVAMLILATCVMGYALLQNRSMQSTQDALQRAYALSILENLSSQIRLNISMFGTNTEYALKNGQTDTSSPDYNINSMYRSFIKLNSNSAFGSLLGSTTCAPAIMDTSSKTACTSLGLMNSDASEALTKAAAADMTIGTDWCPSNVTHLCLIAAWGETQANMSGASTSCLNASGDYMPQASCVFLEVY